MDGDVDEDINQRRLQNMEGYKITGKMKNGVYYGFGRLDHNQWDDTFEGNFDNNYPVNGYEKISGTYEYEGEFFQFVPHGKGKRVWSDGKIEEGEFEHGRFMD